MKHAEFNRNPEEELILLAQQGDESSQLQLLENYKELILSIIPPYFRSNEEFVQEAKVSALESIISYDGGSPLKEYIQETVRKNVKTITNYFNETKFSTKSLDKPLFDDQKGTLGDLISRKEDSDEIIKSIIKKEEMLLTGAAIKDKRFSGQEQNILQQLLDGKEIEEIGVINITVQLLKKLGLYKYTRTEKISREKLSTNYFLKMRDYHY